MRFDDIVLDVDHPIGAHTFERAAILDFARLYDPQPFHVDDEAAAESHFGGLIASGWHTAAAWMRLTVEAARREGSTAGISPGLDEILWLRPVRPGDTISYVNRYEAKRRLKSRPGWALIHHLAVGVNQNGEEVFRMRGPVMVPIDD